MGKKVQDALRLDGKIALVTGGAGLLGSQHCEAIAELGGIPWVIDLDDKRAKEKAAEISKIYGTQVHGLGVDITDENAVKSMCEHVLNTSGAIDILINNAANNPKVEGGGNWSRFENFPLEVWNQDIAVGLTGAFLCSRIAGSIMAENGGGVILNIASDLGVIAPDQRIYRTEGQSFEEQTVKPVTYSVVKSGLIGLTKYMATYWPHHGVRVNALAPGGVEAGQDEAFIKRLTNLIPLGRMAREDEYKSAVAFLVSDASSYMTGTVISMDGGRTAW